MTPGQPNFYYSLRSFIIAGVCIAGLSSCFTIVKNYQPGKPFIYKTNINIKGNFSNDSITMLSSRLKGQLDDSMKVKIGLQNIFQRNEKTACI